MDHEDLERIISFEDACQKAAAEYQKNPQDAENLCQWGCLLLELASFRTEAQAMATIKDAMSKLEESLTINPKRAETLWGMGNAHTSFGFLHHDIEDAVEYFKQAAIYFQAAIKENPTELLYVRSFEMALKAPALHQQVHSKLQERSGKGNEKKKSKNSDLKYDILGWFVLAGAIVAWINMFKLPPSILK